MRKQILSMVVLMTLTMVDVFAAVENNRGGRGNGGSRGGVSRGGSSSRGSGSARRSSPSRNSGRVSNPGRSRNTGRVNNPGRNRNTGRVNNPGRNRNPGRVNNPGRNRNPGRVNNPGRNRNPGRIGRGRVYNPGYRHAPRRGRAVHNRHYTPSLYYRNVYRDHRSSIYLNWIFYPSSRLNGYYYVNGYPYYVYNGYRHRYSSYDICNYQLVDSYTNSVSLNYWNQMCSVGYDMCAQERDLRNSVEYDNRYFCAETFRDRTYRY